MIFCTKIALTNMNYIFNIITLYLFIEVCKYSTANKIFAFLAGNGWAGLNAERPLPATAGHLWYSHLLSRWRHL